MPEPSPPPLRPANRRHCRPDPFRSVGGQAGGPLAEWAVARLLEPLIPPDAGGLSRRTSLTRAGSEGSLPARHARTAGFEGGPGQQRHRGGRTPEAPPGERHSIEPGLRGGPGRRLLSGRPDAGGPARRASLDRAGVEVAKPPGDCHRGAAAWEARPGESHQDAGHFDDRRHLPAPIAAYPRAPPSIRAPGKTLPLGALARSLPSLGRPAVGAARETQRAVRRRGLPGALLPGSDRTGPAARPLDPPCDGVPSACRPNPRGAGEQRASLTRRSPPDDELAPAESVLRYVPGPRPSVAGRTPFDPFPSYEHARLDGTAPRPPRRRSACLPLSRGPPSGPAHLTGHRLSLPGEKRNSTLTASGRYPRLPTTVVAPGASVPPLGHPRRPRPSLCSIDPAPTSLTLPSRGSARWSGGAPIVIRSRGHSAMVPPGAATPRTVTVRGVALELFRRRPTLPGGYPPSTIGAGGLNFRVRDGNGCDSAAMATGNLAQNGRVRAPVSVP